MVAALCFAGFRVYDRSFEGRRVLIAPDTGSRSVGLAVSYRQRAFTTCIRVGILNSGPAGEPGRDALHIDFSLRGVNLQPARCQQFMLLLEDRFSAQCANFEEQVCIMHKFSDCHYDLRKFGRWPK